MGPLIPNGIIGGGWDFVIAILIGVAFGFILEASGFSSSRNLAGVFYGYNFVVLRVFFTALIVAMVGLMYFDYVGWLNLSQIFVLPTFLTPMIVGGVIMGVGFVIGGFCPGTSFTGIAIGKLDAVFFAIGLYLGIFGFSLAFPLFEDFFTSGDMGNVTLMDITGIPASYFAVAFTVMALAAFWGTMFIEKRVRKNMKQYKF
ncbi:YeeE/YedE thiosulfate transporter family protein [Draconibacterium sp. IB214405]|uniref:YeeE/YedE thiosulfate transporter family protein n=1 Tax=Draconibacterium sp. IB214405 TaxID=3097352 RepID=UPI002A0ADFF8|nr:YeeE/YedE thiosulfate transporter family protein [Draconibacterium sp. IB214405]MDX8338353.1 YeeE/YedE thiosulfate transporter family protein [Draconibacterium sp. IB214405]